MAAKERGVWPKEQKAYGKLVATRLAAVLIFNYNIHQVTKRASHRAASNSNSLCVHPPPFWRLENQCRRDSLSLIVTCTYMLTRGTCCLSHFELYPHFWLFETDILQPLVFTRYLLENRGKQFHLITVSTKLAIIPLFTNLSSLIFRM